MAASLRRARGALLAFASPGPRMVDEIECVASVVLAILLAHAIGAHNVAWAAFTGFVLMRGHVVETLVRGAMRLVGTAAGAGLALGALAVPGRSLVATAAIAGGVGAAGLYGMLTGKRGYAWLLFGITFELVLLGKLDHPAIDAVAFARTRLLEVVAGTVACVAVSLATTITARRRWPASPPSRPIRIGWHPQAARHAAQAGIALALLPPLHALFGVRELEQAGVTILAVMIVPAAGIGTSGLGPVSRRLFHRAIGCLGGSAFALVSLLIAHGSPGLLIGSTCLGIALGRHIENSGASYAYVGLQFTLAIIITLVPDSYANAAIQPALARLAAILIGMVILEPVLPLWHAIAPKGGGASGAHEAHGE